MPALHQRYFRMRYWPQQLGPRTRQAAQKVADDPVWVWRKVMRLGWMQGAWWALQTDASWLMELVSAGIST